MINLKWMKLLVQIYCVILCVTAIGNTHAISAEPGNPSTRLSKVIPDASIRLKSARWQERAEVFDLLVIRKADPKGEPYQFLYELQAEDYDYVLAQIIEGMRSGVGESEFNDLMEDAGAWLYVIEKFHLLKARAQIAALINEPNRLLQAFSLQVLGALGASEFDEDIAKLLTPDHKELNRMAREVLLKMKSKKLVPLLLEELARGNSTQRFSAMEALEKIGDSRAIPLLLTCGADAEENLRRAALRILSGLIPKDQQAVLLLPLARQIATTSGNSEVVDNALAVCIDLGDSGLAAAVMEHLTASDFGVRYTIENELAKKSVTVLVPALTAALDRKQPYGDVATNEHVRAGVATMLGRAGTAAAIESLRRAAGEPDRFIQSAVIAVLGDLKAREAIPELLAALKGPAAFHAAIALAQIRDRRSLADLSVYLNGPGSADTNLIYEINRAYNPDLDKKLKTLKLKKTIKAQPNEIFTELSRGYQIPIKISAQTEEFVNLSKLTGAVEVYENEDVDNSIGRALYYLNAKTEMKYCRILREGEVNILLQKQAPQFFMEMFNADFR